MLERKWYAVVMADGKVKFSSSPKGAVQLYYRGRWIVEQNYLPAGYSTEPSGKIDYFDGDTEELLAVASLVKLPKFPK